MIFLGIDCGTQSTKVAALDWETGEILASAGDAYGFVEGLPQGAMEQEPSWWTSAAEKGILSVVGSLGPRASEIAGIGVSGQQHGLVAVDASGEVLRPAKLWCDTSTTVECEEITSALGGNRRAIALTGNTMRAGYTAPKIRWLHKNEPEHYARAAKFLLPHDYLNFWLTGIARMEYGDASGTALLDIAARSWSPEACAAVAPELAKRLPDLGPSSEPCGKLKPELAAKWGISGDVIISAGGGDNMMAAIGTGNVRKGGVTASLGTSGTLFAFSETPISDPKGEIAGFCDSTDHWLPLLCTMNLTLVTEQVRKLFGWSHAEMDAAIATVPPGAGGLCMLPYLTGERTPDLPNARGILAGITLGNLTPAHLARASVEAVVLGLAYGLGRLCDLGVPAEEVRLTGGASESPAWRQICADAFGRPVVCLDSSKGAALGAAIQAGWTHAGAVEGSGASLGEICDRLIPLGGAQRASPDPAAVPVYRDMLGRMRGLRESLGGHLS